MLKIAVVGLGAIGAQVLWQLSRAPGVEVHGYESGYPGHPFAGAGGESRLFRNIELGHPGYMPIHGRADELYRQLEHDSSRALRRLVGVLNIGDRDEQQTQNLISSGQAWGRPFEVLEQKEMKLRFPQFTTGEDDIGVFDVEGGVISPERTVATAAQHAQIHGAQVHSGVKVTRLEDEESSVRLHLADGSTGEYDKVVVAGGGWTTQIVPELRDWIVTKRLTSIWYAGSSDSSLAGMPPFLHVAPTYCYGAPTADGKSVKIGLGFNDHYTTGNPDAVPRGLDHKARQHEIDTFAWVLRDLIKGLDPDPLRIDTYIESYSRNMHEFIGPVSEGSRVIALTGFSGHGFEICPAVGEIGAAIAQDLEPDIDIAFLAEASPAFEIIDAETGTTTYNSVMASGNVR